jgi:hypothetical protein
MADLWTFFASMQAWRASSVTRRPFGSVSESAWLGAPDGVRRRYVLARIPVTSGES